MSNSQITRKTPPEHLSHWHQMIDGLNHSPQEFYAVIEQRIRDRELPETQVGRVIFRERGLLSNRREYLRVMRASLVFDICGAPFGKNAFFVSYWLGDLRRGGCLSLLMVMVPFAGLFMEKHLRPMTYYETDSALMFHDMIRAIVLGHVDELTASQGIEPIPEHERKPTMKKLANL